MKYAVAGLIALSIGFLIYLNRPAEGGANSATAPAAETESWAAEAAAKTKGLIQGVLEEEPLPQEIVECTLEGRVFFMLEHDCTSQGGGIHVGSRIQQSRAGAEETAGQQANAEP